MTTPQMLLAIQIANAYGAQPGAWRMPGVDPSSYTDMDQIVGYAQAAERGKIQLVFLAETPALDVDIEREAPHHAVDPLVLLTSMARATERSGLVATSSTTFNEPFTIARQFKALDVVSHSRAGRNAAGASPRGDRCLSPVRAGTAGRLPGRRRGERAGTGGPVRQRRARQPLHHRAGSRALYGVATSCRTRRPKS